MAPPKATSDLDPNFKFIMSVLRTCETVKPNWDIVAQENGIAYARNAHARFKDILKKQGFRFESGKISTGDKDGYGSNAATAPKKTCRGTEGGKTGNNKKQTAAEMEEDEEVEDDNTAATAAATAAQEEEEA